MVEIGFHLDEHIHHAVATGPRRHGVDVETTVEAGMLGATDEEHLVCAHATGRMIVTQDPDYLNLDRRGINHSGIAYCSHVARHPGYIGHLVEALLLIHAIYQAEEMVGRVEYI